jgi:hypothetical protein
MLSLSDPCNAKFSDVLYSVSTQWNFISAHAPQCQDILHHDYVLGACHARPYHALHVTGSCLWSEPWLSRNSVAVYQSLQIVNGM